MSSYWYSSIKPLHLMSMKKLMTASRLVTQRQDLCTSSQETRRLTFMKIVYGRLHLLVTITNGWC
ncbi:hypothetical protein OH492_14405 [Vibrio chagasii]|nr:hypothetical protein [Vibrio chagasii]